MKPLILMTCFLLVMTGATKAQNRSIHFLHAGEMKWEKILKKARKEQKMIFIDCYTSWCGPCKRLAKDVFTRDQVADFYNSHFICIKYDVEKDKKLDFVNPFGIHGYPTLLFLTAEGKVVHSFMGAFGAEATIQEARTALDEKNNLAGLKRRYDSGEKDPQFLKQYADALTMAAQENSDAVWMEYLSLLPEKEFFSKATWEVINGCAKDILAEPIMKAIRNRGRFEVLVGTEKVERKIAHLLVQAMSPMEKWEPGKPFDKVYYQKLVSCLQTIHHIRIPSYLAELAVIEQQAAGNYRNILNVLQEMVKYNITLSLPDCIDRFAECKDPTMLREALLWLEKVTENKYYNEYFRLSLMKRSAELWSRTGEKEKAEKIKAEMEDMATACKITLSRLK